MDVIEDVDLVSSDEEVIEEYLSPLQAKWYTYIPDSITALCSRLLEEETKHSNGRQHSSIRSNNGSESLGEKESTSSGTFQVIDLTLPPKKLKDLIENDWIEGALNTTLSLPSSSSPVENRIDGNRSEVEVENAVVDDKVLPLAESVRRHSSSSDAPPEQASHMQSPTSCGSETTDSIGNCSDASSSRSASEVTPTLESVSVPDSSSDILQRRVVTVTNNSHFNNAYPCLCVRPRPFLRRKATDNSPLEKSQRLVLDKMVKELIQKSPAQLIEWCIIQGLINPTQTCDVCHSDNENPVAMNLVQYTNPSVHTLTGGYIWICSQCKTCMKSVFTGSIFDKSSYSLVTILKLIYHWVNVTDMSSVIEWVKVEPVFIKHFFSLLRAVCTSAIQEQQGKLGGPSKIVQVGVVSMKPAGASNKRPLTFLGAVDEKCLLRLQLVESLKNGEKCGPEKMARILKPLKEWIDINSVICTDFSINKKYLQNLGFLEVHQVATCAPDVPLSLKYSNVQIKNYLKFQIPNMFKDSIFKLSRAVIQQFLNELTWRERWERSPLETFTKILDHIAAQTRACQGSGLVKKLLKMNEDPFRNWSKGREKSEEIIELTS